MGSSVTLNFYQLLLLALAPALLTGIVGVLGSLVGPWLLEGRKQKAEQKKQRAEKLVELITVLFEHNHWLGLARDIRIFDEAKELPVSPLTRALAISAAYFPQFGEQMTALDKASDEYELWVFTAAQRRGAKDEDYMAGRKEAYEPYIVQFVKVIAELKKYAQRIPLSERTPPSLVGVEVCPSRDGEGRVRPLACLPPYARRRASDGKLARSCGAA